MHDLSLPIKEVGSRVAVAQWRDVLISSILSNGRVLQIHCVGCLNVHSILNVIECVGEKRVATVMDDQLG